MKIAFIVDGFPKLSETFILNQITGLLDLGHEVEIFARYHSNEEKVHSDVKKYRLMERVHYFDMPHNKIKRVLKAIFLIITNFHKNPLKISKSLNVFKYGKEALSLWLFYLIIPFLDKDFDIIQCHFGPNGNMGAYLKQMGFKGKILQTTLWGSDQFIVPSKQGNSCGGRGLAEEALRQGHIFHTQMRVKDGNKTGLITYLINDREVSSEEPDEGKPQVRFCEGGHSNLGTITPSGGAL